MINEKYEEITNPKVFIKNFKNEGHFKNWCNLGSVEDLRCTLSAFEEEEMYEECALIKSVMDYKANKVSKPLSNLHTPFPY